jgi:hypothetical protein
MERRVRHRHTKGTVTDGPLLYITAPTLDPTAAHSPWRVAPYLAYGAVVGEFSAHDTDPARVDRRK